jgi:hypothetical protein
MLFKEIIPLQPKLVYIIFKNPVRTSKRTPHFTITEINWLTLFKEIIAAYRKNHTKPINTKYKVKQSHYTPWSRFGGRGIAPTHSRLRHYMGVSGQRHAPAALYPRGKDPWYPLDRRLGGPQSRSGHRG